MSDHGRPDEAITPARGVLAEIGEWAIVGALTALACLIAWRLSLALGSALILCAIYAVPAAVTTHSLAKALASYCAVTVVGTMLLHGEDAGARLAFILVGLSFVAGVLYLTFGAGRKLADARRGLAIIRLRSQSTRDALQRAGVCVVVVGRNRTWVAVNEAAWNAFGSDARLRSGVDARVELDDEAATALMHSGSKESWRKFYEAVIADGAEELRPGEALPPYKVTLYDVAGRKTRHQFTVTRGQREELVFVGCPVSEPEVESREDESPEVWFREVVSGITEPSVILQSDGAILASNGAFQVLCGARSRAQFIFDCPKVHGASEQVFASAVWMPTLKGARDLPDVVLEGAGPAVGARIAPPKAAYTEAVLVVFKEENRAVPEGFAEVTRPMEL